MIDLNKPSMALKEKAKLLCSGEMGLVEGIIGAPYQVSQDWARATMLESLLQEHSGLSRIVPIDWDACDRELAWGGRYTLEISMDGIGVTLYGGPDKNGYEHRVHISFISTDIGRSSRRLGEICESYLAHQSSLLSLLQARAQQLEAHPIAIQAWGDEGEEVLYG